MRTYRDAINELPADIRDKVIEYATDILDNPCEYQHKALILENAFDWYKTKEGYDYWFNVHVRLLETYQNRPNL
jgi:hypothetical protein